MIITPTKDSFGRTSDKIAELLGHAIHDSGEPVTDFKKTRIISHLLDFPEDSGDAKLTISPTKIEALAIWLAFDCRKIREKCTRADLDAQGFLALACGGEVVTRLEYNMIVDANFLLAALSRILNSYPEMQSKSAKGKTEHIVNIISKACELAE